MKTTTTAAELAPVMDHLTHLFRTWASTDHGVTLRGSRYVALPAGAFGTFSASTTGTTMTGFALAETSGAAGAVVRLHNGLNTAADTVITVRLAAGESVRDEFTRGITFPYGVLVEIVSGAVEGSVFLAPGT